MRSRRKTHAVAFTGILTALCVVFLYLGSVIEVLDYTVSALGGIIVTLATVEYGSRAGIAVWLGSSVISLLLFPSNLSSLLFVLFCGWYSLVKSVFERQKRIISVVLKALTFNLSLAVIAFITIKLLISEAVSLPVIIAMVLIANVTFFIYDLLLNRLILLYVLKYRKKLGMK